jgi:2-methylcitrate dehydratase PrpD
MAEAIVPQSGCCLKDNFFPPGCTSGAKNIGVGHAARNGFFAALMAARGYTGAPAALEGPYGWARACGDMLQQERLVAELGV